MSDINGGLNLMMFGGQFVSTMKNFTANTYYGVSSNGNLFNLVPETYYQNNLGGMNLNNVIYVNVLSQTSFIENKPYMPPMDNYPLYIPSHNVVLFASAEERAKCIEMYEDGAKLVKSYAAGVLQMVNASYKAITCLNTDREFFILNGSAIEKIPTVDEDYKTECLKKYKVTPEQLDINDVFIINTTLKNTKSDMRELKTSTDIKIIDRNKLIKDQPIIFENDGLVIFDGRDAADNFVKKFGNATNYMVHRALEATRNVHEGEIEDLNEQVAKDKHGMVETFGLMGATSVASILTENLIKSYNESGSDKEAIKNALKIMGIVAIGGISIVGLYKLYRTLKDKSENEEKARKKAAYYKE